MEQRLSCAMGPKIACIMLYILATVLNLPCTTTVYISDDDDRSCQTIHCFFSCNAQYVITGDVCWSGEHVLSIACVNTCASTIFSCNCIIHQCCSSLESIFVLGTRFLWTFFDIILSDIYSNDVQVIWYHFNILSSRLSLSTSFLLLVSVYLVSGKLHGSNSNCIQKNSIAFGEGLSVNARTCYVLPPDLTRLSRQPSIFSRRFGKISLGKECCQQFRDME